MNVRLFLIGSALLFTQLLFSQDRKLIDSLEHRLRELGYSKPVTGPVTCGKNDSLVTDILFLLSRAYWGNNPGKAMDYAKQILALAELSGNKKGMADAYFSMGVVERDNGNTAGAQQQIGKAMNMYRETGDQKGVALTRLSLGNLYFMKGDYSEALNNYYESMKISEQTGDKKTLARTLSNIGNVCFRQGNYETAEKHYTAVLKLFMETGDRKGLGSAHHNLGNIQMMQHHNREALTNYSAALVIFKETGDRKNTAKTLTTIGIIQRGDGNFDDALRSLREALDIFETLKDKEGMADACSNIGNTCIDMKKYSDASEYISKALSLSKEIGSLENMKNNYRHMVRLDSARGDFRQALAHYKSYVEIRDSLVNVENTRKSVERQMQYEFEKKETLARAIQEKKDVLAQKELQKQKWMRNGFIGGFTAVLVFAMVFLMQRTRIAREKRKSDLEKKRSEELLLNILPLEVAEELKSSGTSHPRTYSMVSVMFTDFVDFTKISERVSAELLVEELNECFSEFDRILEKHKVEKIKTIGDAYLCASGIPALNYTHAIDLVTAAVEIRDFILARKWEKESRGEIAFELRIGIHTGPVVAGIVGVKKFAYDIWGDTVNTAARMEQSGAPGRINISGSTYQLVKDRFTCIHRGRITVKNKSEIDMYFVEGPADPLAGNS